jgi:hypothetical protein
MELYLEPERRTRNAINGRILPGHVPLNKGKKWGEYKVPKKSRKKILANLTDEGRKLGAKASKPLLCIKIVGILNGEFMGMFESASDAQRKMAKIGIKVCHENIRNCCKGKRQRAGGINWFYESDFEKWSKEIVEK